MPVPRLVQPTPLGLADRSDDELMTLAQTGMRPAFAVLVERHAEHLVQVCARFVNHPDAGAELAQETWVAIWASRAQYRAEGKFPVWLIAAARNRCRNHLQHLGARRSLTARHSATDEAPPTASQVEALLLEERRRRVREAVSRLPERMREALLLRYAEDLPYEEMAEVLRVGESTLRSRVHHGLRLLRTLLEKSR